MTYVETMDTLRRRAQNAEETVLGLYREIERLREIIREADAALYTEKGEYHQRSDLGIKMTKALALEQEGSAQ